MELTGSYRHELKYQNSPADHHALRQRLRTVMKCDPHTGADGFYTIRSVYFDNYKDKALREKVNGVQKREKFRIRYYNDDFSFITLEKKIKHNDLCMKIDAPLTVEEYRRILREPGPWMLEHPDGLVRELYCKMKTQQLRPPRAGVLCAGTVHLRCRKCPRDLRFPYPDKPVSARFFRWRDLGYLCDRCPRRCGLRGKI